MKAGSTIFTGILAMLTIQTKATFAPDAVIRSMQTVRFPVKEKSFQVDAYQKNFADSVFNHLAPGEGAFLVLLTPQEELKLTNVEKANLTYKRAQAILVACHRSNYPKKEYYAEITPTNAPNKILTFDLTPSMYRSYSTGNAVTGVIFAPKDRIATSNGSVAFDSNIQNEVKSFTVDPKSDMVAKLESGTKITIPQGSLVYPNGKEVTDPVAIEVAEYTEMDAIVMKSMTTMCGNRELMSGGMWNIHATCNGQDLKMKSGAHYNIEVFNNKDVKNMQVFTGKIKNGKIDWVLENDGKVTAETVTIGSGNGRTKNEQSQLTNVNVINDINTDNVNEFELNQNIRNNTRNNLNYVPNKEDVDKYYKKRKEMAVTEEEKVMIEEEEARYQNVYNLKLNDFGWINCDAFYEAPVKVNFLVSGDVTTKTTVMLVYPKRKSVLNGYICTDGKSVKFENVASDEQALLVVFAQAEGSDAIVKYTKMITPGNEKNVVVKTSPSTYSALKSEINAKTADI